MLCYHLRSYKPMLHGMWTMRNRNAAGGRRLPVQGHHRALTHEVWRAACLKVRGKQSAMEGCLCCWAGGPRSRGTRRPAETLWPLLLPGVTARTLVWGQVGKSTGASFEVVSQQTHNHPVGTMVPASKFNEMNGKPSIRDLPIFLCANQNHENKLLF